MPLDSVLWVDSTDATIGFSTAWTNKVELADIDGDGDVDILFADGGMYEEPGNPTVNQVWINDGRAGFTDHSTEVFGKTGDLTRVIKAGDVNDDGLVDLMIGNTFETQSRLFMGTGGLRFEEVTASNLPQMDSSIGDLEFGDVDGDGDLDLVAADWGSGSPLDSEGGRTMLWLNDGTGVFTDVTDERMPDILVRFSWELELVDIDNDWDLDIAVSCKVCEGSYLFENDGAGTFADISERLPQFSNNYEFEPMDLNDDGFIDLVTINDRVDSGGSLKQNIFLNDGAGGYVDATADLWPDEDNPSGDDNMIVFLDFDSDGDGDFIIGSLELSDRLLINDGSGRVTLFTGRVFNGSRTPGTLGIAAADLNGDNKIDIVQAQGEVAFDNRVYLGEGVGADVSPPFIGVPVVLDGFIHVRVHDRKSPFAAHDLTSVEVTDGATTVPMVWYGEYLWRAALPSAGTWSVCATDAAGNAACSNPIEGDVPSG